jgi:hypothetical protein
MQQATFAAFLVIQYELHRDLRATGPVRGGPSRPVADHFTLISGHLHAGSRGQLILSCNTNTEVLISRKARQAQSGRKRAIPRNSAQESGKMPANLL